MARVVFFLYLAVAVVCGIITLAYPPWWGGYGGLYGALASLAAALPWSGLLWLAAYFLYPLAHLLEPVDGAFGYGSAATLLYGTCWGLVLLNLYILGRFAGIRRSRPFRKL